jgi:hypothetical protein
MARISFIIIAIILIIIYTIKRYYHFSIDLILFVIYNRLLRAYKHMA